MWVGFKQGKVYMYELCVRPPFSRRPSYVGADHGDDYFFTFDFLKFHKTYGVDDRIDNLEHLDQTANAFMQYLVSFAKTG